MYKKEYPDQDMFVQELLAKRRKIVYNEDIFW